MAPALAPLAGDEAERFRWRLAQVSASAYEALGNGKGAGVRYERMFFVDKSYRKPHFPSAMLLRSSRDVSYVTALHISNYTHDLSLRFELRERSLRTAVVHKWLLDSCRPGSWSVERCLEVVRRLFAEVI